MKTNPTPNTIMVNGSFLERFFSLSENNTNVKTEVIAGITTFLTMAYIIAVNPDILSATGMPKDQLLTATCLAAGLITILMGLYAKMPFALASNMGLNAYFAFSVCLEGKIHWTVALTAVFVEGIIFIILSLTKIRDAVVNAIPKTLKIAVSAGIGLFIAFVGLVNGKVVVNSDATLVTLGRFTDPRALITIFGVIVIGILVNKKIKGAILWGILASTVAAWGFTLGVGTDYAAKAFGIYLPEALVGVAGIGDIAFKLDFSFFNSSNSFWAFVSVMLTFLFVDFFDTVGTLVGVSTKVNILDGEGKIPRAKQAFFTDAIGTTMGALMGTSTVTTYAESSAGVAEGGKTGLTSVITGLLFLVVIIFSPIFLAIPSCATAPALIMVGFFMMQNIVEINFMDYTEVIPAFLTIALMPLTFSIADGLMFGTIAYVIFNLLAKKFKKISAVMYVLAIIFIIRLATF